MFGSRGPSRADLERLELKLVLQEAAGQRAEARAESLAVKLGRAQGRIESLVQEKRTLAKRLRAVSDDYTKLAEELETLRAERTAGGDETPPKDEDEARTKIAPAQRLLDQAEEQIGFADDQSRQTVRTYIERQLRLRGSEAADEILLEVLAGDSSHDDDEG